MNEETTTRSREPGSTAVTAEERRAEAERRLDEAADVLAETLLDLWRKEQRARRSAASGGAS